MRMRNEDEDADDKISKILHVRNIHLTNHITLWSSLLGYSALTQATWVRVLVVEIISSKHPQFVHLDVFDELMSGRPA